MGFFQNIFNSNGSMGMEYQAGNQRFDLTKPEGHTTIIGGQNSGMRTVIRSNGQIAQEWEMGNKRISSDKGGFDILQ